MVTRCGGRGQNNEREYAVPIIRTWPPVTAWTNDLMLSWNEGFKAEGKVYVIDRQLVASTVTRGFHDTVNPWQSTQWKGWLSANS
jgi:hypothetical protein